jgi:hypothetical protein
MTIDWGSQGIEVIITAGEEELLVSVDGGDPLSCSGKVRLVATEEGDVSASCVLEMSLQEVMAIGAEQNFVLPLNPRAAFLRQIMQDGFVPVGYEYMREYNGMTFVGQQAQRPNEDETALETRIYFSKFGDWDDIHWFGRGEQ